MSDKNLKSQYLTGVRAGIPVILGFVPVGIAYAIMARQAGFSVFETIFMSVAVFAGAYVCTGSQYNCYDPGNLHLEPSSFDYEYLCC